MWIPTGICEILAQAAGVSQIDLALECDTSARHLSCVETERAHPSRHLLLRLCATLDIPLRARNSILISAATRSCMRETGLSDPEMAEARRRCLRIRPAHQRTQPHHVAGQQHGYRGNVQRRLEKLFTFPGQDPGMLLAEEKPNLNRLVQCTPMASRIIVEFERMYRVMMERARRSLLTGAPDRRLREVLRSWRSTRRRTRRRRKSWRSW